MREQDKDWIGGRVGGSRDLELVGLCSWTGDGVVVLPPVDERGTLPGHRQIMPNALESVLKRLGVARAADECLAGDFVGARHAAPVSGGEW